MESFFYFKFEEEIKVIVVLNKKADQKEVDKLKKKLVSLGCQIHEIAGENRNVIGLIGDMTKVDTGLIKSNRVVDKLIFVEEPYKKANRLFHEENSVIKIGKESVGDKKITIMAGPCSIESEDQILEIARSVKKSGATFLRGGAFKPRTSPYSFQGMGEDGLELLKLARRETGLPIVTELMSTDYLDLFVEDVDIIQIGARNMQNFDLLKEVGKTDKPVLLKRGMSATVKELLMSAEYIMSGGNENVILCERGIRTFENYTRNTLDLSAIPVIKKLSHLPVIVDPSHASGMWWLVEPLAKAAVSVGADGLMIEVHNDPDNAKCDGEQSITPERFEHLVGKLRSLAEIENRTV